MSRVIDEHRLYLRDRNRLSAYERGIGDVVKAGDVVVDLASGTGILGMLAARAGAARVYAIEQEGIAGLARQIVRANGLDNVITSIRGYSRAVTLPERADVVVSDQIGGFGLDALIVDLFRDARERFLRQGGTLIPRSLELMVAAVEERRLHQRLGFWRRRPANFDYTAAAEVAANTGYPARLRPASLISEPARAATVDLTTADASPLHAAASLGASRAGVLHGIGGWFVAHLSPRATMTNSPLSAERIYRRPVFFPIEEEVAVEPGTRIDFSIRILVSDFVYSWDVEVHRLGSVRRFRQTTLRGMLLSREDLERTNPGYRPSLTPSGHARLTVLELCDGRHPLGDIERAVFEQHRELFTSPAQAAMFVAEVVTRYSQ